MIILRDVMISYAHALVELKSSSKILRISESVSSYESVGLLLVGCLQG